MSREEFEKGIIDLVNQLEDFVENSLPDLPELEDSLNVDDYDASKSAFLLTVNDVHFSVSNLSDKYFD